MRKGLTALAHLNTAILALLPALPLQADSAKWYRVELLVFDDQAGGAAEQWDALPRLAYPDTTTYLVEPNHPEARLPGGAETSRAASAELRERAPASRAPASAGPFATLPPNQREFNTEAARLAREAGHRVIFHQAWMMPIGPKARAIPIVLDSSGDDGSWPLLQGTVTLYVARYLYVSTNLWLNTSGDYLSSDWRMPAPPLGPITGNKRIAISPGAALTDVPTSADSLQIASTALASPARSDARGDRQLNNSVNSGAGQAAHRETELGPLYPFRHAVTLRQNRRMRSTEIHYIDHPMIGAVIKITPIAES